MKRWLRIVAVVVFVSILIMAAMYVYLIPMRGLERIVTGRLNKEIRDRYSLTASVGNIRGNPFTGLMLEDVSISYTDSLGSYEVIRLPRLTTAYRLSNLWNRDYRFELVEIGSASVTVRRDSVGAYRLPALSSGTDTPSRQPSFYIGNLILSDASLQLIAPGQDTVRLQQLTLATSLHVDEGMVSADLKQMGFALPLQDIDLTAATGKVTFSERRVTFQDLMLVSGGTRARLDGSVMLEDLSGQVEFAFDHVDMEQVSRWIGPNLHGVVDLTGTVTRTNDTLSGSVNIGGSFMIASLENLQVDFRLHDKMLELDTLYGVILGDCAIDGYGGIDFSGAMESYRLNASIRNFNLDNLITGTFQSDLNGDIVLVGESFRTATMRMMIAADLYESSFDEYPLQRAYGPMMITTDSLTFTDPFVVAYHENEFAAAGSIVYSGDINLRVEAALENLDRYRGRLFIDQPGGRGRAHAVVSGKTADPDLRATFVSDSVWIYGLSADSCVIDADIKRFLSGRQGWAQADFYAGSLWGTPFDSALTRLTLDSQTVIIDTAAVRSPDLFGSSLGIFDYGVYPNRVELDTTVINLFGRGFYNRGTVDIEIDSSGFVFNRLYFAQRGGLLSLAGRINYDETMDFRASADSIVLSPWVRLFAPEWQVDGHISFNGRVGGSFANPAFSLTGIIDSLTYRGLKLGELTAAGAYENRVLTVDSAVVLSDSGRYVASGFLNADLAFVTDSIERLPDLPFDIRITARDNQFELVSLMLPSVEQLNGEFEADFRLSGIPSDPHLEGSAQLVGAQLKYFDLVNWVFADSVSVRMEDDRIMIDGIEAYVLDNRKGKERTRTIGMRDIGGELRPVTVSGKPSYAYIEGEIRVASLDNFVYELDVSIPREFPFEYELEDIEGVFEGELQIVGETPPTVTGDITLISCRYRVPFASAEEGSPILEGLTEEDSWDLDLNIEILSNYWIENEDIDAEFAGEVNLVREDGNYPIVGQMDILRGRGFLFDKIFRLEAREDAVIFTGTEIPNPQLDIVATTRIPGVRYEQEAASDVIDLCIHVTGSLDTADINVCEDSPFSREDILSLIALNYYGADTGSYGGAIEERVSQFVGSQISRVGARQLSQLGVETFEIDPAYGGEFDPANTRVTLGVYAAPNLYVYGRSNVSGTIGEEVGFEYRFSREFLLQGRRNELEEYILNLRLHWEF
ncbi:MAG: translocation/assembly module TamB domain-containing protein [candidate division Zixibacteria bacterium]|jgi:autotransporter translocation and assembly factor TamB|nr:translocation/assembly module TamB domain-containing protein [candidate division Zixibacteria bacterium]